MQTDNKKEGHIGERSRNLAEIQRFTLFSNVFLSVALDDVRACEYVLRILLKDNSLELRRVKTQYTILKLESRDAWLDVLAEGRDGTLYGLEIQNKNNVDHPRRVRFYESMIDSSFLQKGTEFRELPDLRFLYICRRDFLKTGVSAKEVDRVWSGTGDRYVDGAVFLYVNAQVQDGTETARLMQYFQTADPEDMGHGALSKRVHFLKREKGGQKLMCEITEKIERRGMRRGIRRGEDKLQSLIAAMVRAGDADLLPRLGEDREFLAAMYKKYQITSSGKVGSCDIFF